MAAMSLTADLHRDPAPRNISGQVDSEKGDQTATQDGLQSRDITTNTTRWRARGLWNNVKMYSCRQLLFTVLIVIFLTSAFASRPVIRKAEVTPSAEDEAAFQELLSQVSDASLHEVLHEVLDKFKHGVWPEDRTAMKAVHKDDPAMATSLVQLARRQNATFTGVVPATSTDTVIVVPPQSTNTVVVVQTTPIDTVGSPATTPNAPGGTSTAPQVSTVPPSPPPLGSSSIPVSVPSPGSPAQTIPDLPQSSQANPASPFKTSAAPAPGTTGAGTASGTGVGTGLGTATNPAGGSISSGAAPAGVNSSGAGSTKVVSTSPDGSSPTTPPTRASSTQQIIWTTTLPNGSRSTVTSYTIVPAGEQASTPGASPTLPGVPSLQNGAMEGGRTRNMGAMGALGAILLFVMGLL